MTGLWAERYRVRQLEGPKHFLLQNVQTGSVAHPAPILWLVSAPTPGVSAQGLKMTDQTPPPSAVVENGSSHTSAPPPYRHSVHGTPLPEPYLVLYVHYPGWLIISRC
jgi:hypothetical protein